VTTQPSAGQVVAMIGMVFILGLAVGFVLGRTL